MKKIEVLSVPFYEFRCDPALMDEIQPLVESMNFEQKPSGVGISKDFFYHKTLFEWFNDCLEDVRKIYYIDIKKWNLLNSLIEYKESYYYDDDLWITTNTNIHFLNYFSDDKNIISKNFCPWSRSQVPFTDQAHHSLFF